MNSKHVFALALSAAVSAGPFVIDSASAGSLKGLCPDTVVFQTDWYPQVENSLPYQMIGEGGVLDADKGIYTGPLGDTGVKLELRIGGPFVGYQTVTALMYQDPSITLGLVSTDEAIIASAKFPTVGVLGPMTKSPEVLMFAKDDYPGLKSWDQVKGLDAKILYFEGSSFMTYLLGKGYVRKEQLDSSYDGSPARFAVQKGLLQSGFVTNEVFRYQNEIEKIKKPIGYLLVADAGYDVYTSAVAVKPDAIEKEAKCLAALVPLMQRAQVDYLKSPEKTNAVLLKINASLKSPWTISPAVNAYGDEKMLELGLMANSPDGAFGSFDMPRLRAFVSSSLSIFKAAGITTIKEGLKADDLVTNAFIDPEVKL